MDESQVPNLIEPGVGRRTDLVQATFLDFEAKLILSIPLAQSDRSDKLIWHYNKSRRTSVKSGCCSGKNANRWRFGIRKQNGQQGAANTRCPVRWIKPRGGVVKLNVDGALDVHNGVYGTGAVCKDENGSCLGVLAALGYGNLSPLAVEAMALVNGQHFCINAGFTRIEIEGDALSLFTPVDAALDDLSEVRTILDEANDLISHFDFCSWGFIPRSGNKAAHLVARTTLSLPFPTYWWHLVTE
ncbi:hypothetical protein ACLB2K_035765 [Fragaria x ananassa]